MYFIYVFLADFYINMCAIITKIVFDIMIDAHLDRVFPRQDANLSA